MTRKRVHLLSISQNFNDFLNIREREREREQERENKREKENE